MTDLTTILKNLVVAYSPAGVTQALGFININGLALLDRIRQPTIGKKDGEHFLRCSLATDESGKCLARSDANSSSLANLLIIDCDKRIDANGEILEGAPDPHKISQALRSRHIGHILYGSYSHYVGNIGNRFRIAIPTEKAYNKEQLPPTLEATISLINSNLDGELLCNVKENSTWSQPWYTPRKPTDSFVETLFIEYMEGNAISITEKPDNAPLKPQKRKKEINLKDGVISPILDFNEQCPLKGLLIQYGYKKVYITKEYEKWLSPQSKSGIAGITVSENKFFSHHNDEFNDGYWHDAFDLMRVHEGLSNKEAIKRAAQSARVPDGRTIDQHNKSLASKTRDNAKTSKIIPHTEILNQLLQKITSINFRKKANIKGNEKLKPNHFQIIAIETILELAKLHNWGICRNHDFVYLYNGAYWSLIGIEELKAFLGEAAEKMGIDRYTARHFYFREQLYKQFIALAHLPKPEQPKDVVFINLKNGTFEITPTSTRLRLFSRSDFITYQLPFAYSPTEKAPQFECYLNKVLPDKKLQAILAEYLGYVFIRPSTLKLEKTLLLHGKGANGKSVFYEIVRALFGEQNTSEYSLQSLTNDNGYYRAMISHKLVNYATEINGKLETSIFKQLVSGEPVEARLPYGNPFTITDYAKLIFNCNELPKDVEQTDAYFRRVLIVPFSVVIPEQEQDKELAKKIIDAELSGIFNWVLEGLKRLLAQKKFTDSEVARQAREQYRRESDSAQLFIDETGYSSSATGFVALKDLYPEYRTFCLDEGFKPVNSTNFKKRLENLNIVIEKKSLGKVAFITKNHPPSAYSQASEGW